MGKKKRNDKKEAAKKAEVVQAAEKAETTEPVEKKTAKPAARKAAALLPTVEKPAGRSAVRKGAKTAKEVVKEIEVVREVEVVKEAEKKAVTPYVCLQYLGGETDINEIAEKAKKIWQDNNLSQEEFKSMDLYVKPEDNMAYYVINGTDTGKVELGL